MELFHTGFFHLTVCLEDSSRSFHGLVAQLFLSLNTSSYFGCLSLSLHLLKDILVADSV